MHGAVPRDGSDYLRRLDQLLVVRDPPGRPQQDDVEIFVIVGGDGRVTAFNGNVDLRTGIGTALAQIVAEELMSPSTVSPSFRRYRAHAEPGPTIAATIQVTAAVASGSATARQALLARAAERSPFPTTLRIENGTVIAPARRSGAPPSRNWSMGGASSFSIDADAPLKPSRDYGIVGKTRATSMCRRRRPSGLVYVHDCGLTGGSTAASFTALCLGRCRTLRRHEPHRGLIVLFGDLPGLVAN